MKRIFSDKEIVLGVTGSIAAYKACDVASRLVQSGARVTPVLTRAAQELVRPASFQAITGRPAITKVFDSHNNRIIGHVDISTRADLFLVAPATANLIAKAAHGIADDWLTTALLATTAPVLFAPAMNAGMYAHDTTRANIDLLEHRGISFVGPVSGRLACGIEGPGRMVEPAIIVEAAVPLVFSKKDLAGKRVLITSGGNREPIDPVRYIGNRSSGKMGRELALAALARGASVTVVTGPAEMPLPYGIDLVEVETAGQMLKAVLPRARDADVVIGAAAVADYRVDSPLRHKHKRSDESFSLTLVQNPDVLARVAQEKDRDWLVVGFAAETRNVAENAAAKLARKELDLVVANEVGGDCSAFGADSVKAIIVKPNGAKEELGLIEKEDLAHRLLDEITKMLA